MTKEELIKLRGMAERANNATAELDDFVHEVLAADPVASEPDPPKPDPVDPVDPVEPVEPTPHPPTPPVVVGDSHAERDGIRFEFKGSTPVSWSVLGDPVVPPGTELVGMTPPARVQEPGRAMNGAMLNPAASGQQGYDSHLLEKRYRGNDYLPRFNVGRTGRRLTLAEGDSVVKVISPIAQEVRPAVERAAVLTCGVAPSHEFLRPWASAGGKFHSVQDVLAAADERLPALDMPEGFPNLADLSEDLSHLWLDHFDTWLNRYMHPTAWMPDYGRGVADATGIALIAAMMADHPQGRELVLGLVQRGLDWAGWAKNGSSPSTSTQRYMAGAAGHNNGRRSIVALAGMLTQDPSVASVKPPGGMWSEEEQFFHVSGREALHGVGYSEEDLGQAEWGTNPFRQPEKNDRNWAGDPYRQCCTMNALWGHALALEVCRELGAHWSNERAFREYAKRYDVNESRVIARGQAKQWQLTWSEWSEWTHRLWKWAVGAKEVQS